MSSCIVRTRISDCWYSFILLFFDVSGTQNRLGQWVAVLCTPEYQTADIHLSFYSFDVSGTWYTLGQWVAVLCTSEYQTADIHLSFYSFDVSGTWNTLGQWVAVLCTPEYQTADIHLSFYSFDVSGTQNTLGQWVAELCSPEYQTADIHLSFYSLMFLSPISKRFFLSMSILTWRQMLRYNAKNNRHSFCRPETLIFTITNRNMLYIILLCTKFWTCVYKIRQYWANYRLRFVARNLRANVKMSCPLLRKTP